MKPLRYAMLCIEPIGQMKMLPPAIAFLLLSACAPVLSDTKLLGIYEGQMENLNIRLILQKDHTHRESIYASGAAEITANGAWSRDGYSVLVHRAAIPQDYGHIVREDWLLDPEFHFGATVLIDYGTDLELKRAGTSGQSP